jgi:hypothetical protein
VTSRVRRRLPACAWQTASILLCLGIGLLIAVPANGESLGLSSYNSWQWGGFSRSAAPAASSLSVLASLTNDQSAADELTNTSADLLTGSATLSGVVYFDENQDGIRDGTDWAIRDAVVLLTSSDGSIREKGTTDSDGVYIFVSLPVGDYTITLLTPSSLPETPSLGTIVDASNNLVTTGLGTVSGTATITEIHLGEGYAALNYDFPQMEYPTDLLSKRSLLNSDSGTHHTTPVPPVPEPGAWSLLAIAGMLLASRRLLRRGVSKRPATAI